MAPPSSTISLASCSERFAPAVERSTGICFVARSTAPRTGTLKRLTLARKWGIRFWLKSMCPTTSGSISVQWFGAAMKPPAGSFSSPSHFFFISRFIAGRTIPATRTKAMWLAAVSFTRRPLLGCADVEIGAEARELFGETLVAAVDDVDPGDS